MRNSDVSSREEKEARETILQNVSLKPLRYYHADEEKANNNKESGSGSFSDDDEKEGGLGLLPPISPRVYAGAKDLRFKETDWRRLGVALVGVRVGDHMYLGGVRYSAATNNDHSVRRRRRE